MRDELASGWKVSQVEALIDLPRRDIQRACYEGPGGIGIVRPRNTSWGWRVYEVADVAKLFLVAQARRRSQTLEEACREFMYQISERHGHLFVFNNRCGILQFAVCILREVISSVVLRHPSCHIIILSGGATFPHYRCGGVLYAPLLLGLSAYVLACDGQSQRKRGVAIPIYI